MGVRSVVVEFGVFGAHRFSIQVSQNPLKIGIWGPLDRKSGRPKNAKSYHDGSDPPSAALWNKHDSQWTLVLECPCEKFMNRPFFGLVCWGHSWLLSLLFEAHDKNFSFLVSRFLVFLVCFYALAFCYFGISYLSENISPKIGNSKNLKDEKCRKWQGQIAQVRSQIVFFFLCVLLKTCIFCWKHYTNSGFSHQKTKCREKLCQKLVQSRVENWSKYVVQHNWTSFDTTFSFLLFLLASSFHREIEIFKTKK